MKERDCQTLIERIQKLQEEIDGIRPELQERVLEVAKRYIVACHTTNQGYRYPEPEYADFEWVIESDSVNVDWDETWAYGGHDAGTFAFPVKYIWDEGALVAYEETRIETKKTRQKAKSLARQTKELKQLNILKEKYPEA